MSERIDRMERVRAAVAEGDRLRQQRLDTAERLSSLGECVSAMAEAMREDDDVLGALACSGVENHLAALPKHVRDLFTECSSDEAAAGYVADLRYLEARADV